MKTAQSQSELWETKVVSIFTTELSDLDLGKGNEGSLKAIKRSEQKQQKSDTPPPFKPPLSIKPKVLWRFPPILIPLPSSPGDTTSMSLVVLSVVNLRILFSHGPPDLNFLFNSKENDFYPFTVYLVKDTLPLLMSIKAELWRIFYSTQHFRSHQRLTPHHDTPLTINHCIGTRSFISWMYPCMAQKLLRGGYMNTLRI